jgi:1-deoxy-D-xylulose-5-phosphate reductoisomerase
MTSHPRVTRIAILGSTGSIGTSALAVIDAHPDRLGVVALAAGENDEKLAEQIARYKPKAVAMRSAGALDRLSARGPFPGVRLAGAGPEGLASLAAHPDVDLVLCASSGTDGLDAVLAGIERGKTIALANKEVLVMAGGIVTAAARQHGAPILPVDSEHNAIHQCVHGRLPSEIKRLVLTASGGPFRGRTAAELAGVSAAEALHHPTWQMGRKITVDSATLMNKGLEVIEAHWLFGCEADRIDVVIHPQSVVHSMVELVDGSIIAQLGVTDMRLPIQYAFSYPERWPAPLPSLDLVRMGRLDFEVPDSGAFPCLALAYRALRGPSSLPVVLNAANEVAVACFLDGRLPFPGIGAIIDDAMRAHEPCAVTTLAEVRKVDTWARAYSQNAAAAIRSSI